MYGNTVNAQSRFTRDLHSRSKLQFYPTDSGEAANIARMFDLEGREFNILEPCIGDAVAVDSFLRGTDGEKLSGANLFACELSKELFDEHIEGNKNVTMSLNEDFLQTEGSRRSFSLVFCNPPYGRESLSRKRLENQFLLKLNEYLMPGGYLVWIVPIQLWHESDSIDAFLKRFSPEAIYRFKESEYKKYKQVVVVGKKRTQQGYTKAEFNQFRSDVVGVTRMKELSQVEEHGFIPPQSKASDVRYFRSSVFDYEKASSYLEQSPLKDRLLTDMEVTPYTHELGRPPLVPKLDQIFNIIAVGRTKIKQLANGLLQRGVVKEFTTETTEETKSTVKVKVLTFTKSTLTLIAGDKIARLE